MSKNKEYLQLRCNIDDFHDFKESDYNFKFEKYKGGSLSKIEIDILKIAKEILKLKHFSSKFEIDSELELTKYPILEKLYSKCISKYLKNYSKKEIFLAIQNLVKNKWIISNQRRTKEEILNNEKYIVILNFIRNNPGIHASDKKIEKDLDLTRTPFLKYMITLQNFGLIRSTKIGKKLHFFSIEFPESYEKIYTLLCCTITLKIIGEILKRDTISIAEISRELHLFPNAIQYHLKKLQEVNLIKIGIGDIRNFIVNLSILEKYVRITKSHEVAQLL